jgi:hypothetical protein
MDRALGKLPVKHDDRTLLFASYAKATQLPTGNTDVVAPEIPMYANDRVGDCGVAGQAHMVTSWIWKDEKRVVLPTEAEVLLTYKQISGWNGVVNDPSDTGVVLLDALNNWRRNGIYGQHKIGAYVKVNPRNAVDMRAAAYLFGGLYLGFNLPAYVAPLNRWALRDDPKDWRSEPGSWGGHCVNLARWTSRDKRVATWGGLLGVTYEFIQRYCDEAYAVLSTEWLGKDARSPQGFDINALKADLAQL